MRANEVWCSNCSAGCPASCSQPSTASPPTIWPGRPSPARDTIGWLVWHLTRVQDDHVAEVAGHPPGVGGGQLGVCGSACPPEAMDTGYGGYTADQVPGRAPRERAGARRVLRRRCRSAPTRFVRELKDDDLDRVVDGSGGTRPSPSASGSSASPTTTSNTSARRPTCEGCSSGADPCRRGLTPHCGSTATRATGCRSSPPVRRGSWRSSAATRSSSRSWRCSSTTTSRVGVLEALAALQGSRAPSPRRRSRRGASRTRSGTAARRCYYEQAASATRSFRRAAGRMPALGRRLGAARAAAPARRPCPGVDRAGRRPRRRRVRRSASA